MEKKTEKSDIEQLMANVEAEGGKLASIGCGLGGYWMRFGGPDGDIDPELAASLRNVLQKESDRSVSGLLANIRHHIDADYLDEVANRCTVVATVWAAELRGLLEPDRQDGMTICYRMPDGHIVGVMGGAPMAAEQIVEDIENSVDLTYGWVDA